MLTVTDRNTGKSYRCRKLGADRYHVIGTCRFYTESEIMARFKVSEE